MGGRVALNGSGMGTQPAQPSAQGIGGLDNSRGYDDGTERKRGPQPSRAAVASTAGRMGGEFRCLRRLWVSKDTLKVYVQALSHLRRRECMQLGYGRRQGLEDELADIVGRGIGENSVKKVLFSFTLLETLG